MGDHNRQTESGQTREKTAKQRQAGPGQLRRQADKSEMSPNSKISLAQAEEGELTLSRLNWLDQCLLQSP